MVREPESWDVTVSEADVQAMEERLEALQDAISSGALTDELCNYYGRDMVYSVSVNGERIDIPIYADSDWLTPVDSPNDVLGDLDTSFDRKHNVDPISQAAKRIAALSADDPPVTISLDEILFNGDVYQIVDDTVSPKGTPVFDFQMTDYFTYLSSGDAVYQETIDRLIDGTGIDGELRAKHAGSIRDILTYDSHSKAGVITALILASEDGGYELLVHKRPSNTVESPGLWSVLPAGGFESMFGSYHEALDLRHTMLRECSEELYGEHTTVDDSSIDDIKSWKMYSTIEDYIDSGKADFIYTSMFLSLDAPRFSFGGLLCVHDIDAAKTMRDNLVQSWETGNGIDFVSLPLDEPKDFLSPTHTAPDALGVLYEAFHVAENRYDIDIGLDIERI